MTRKFVFKNIKLRLVSIFVFAACSLIVWNWNSDNKSIPARYLVFLQPAPKTIFQDRDMSIYDLGGTITDCFNTGPISNKELKDCMVSEKQAREFIYRHWQDKKLAYISFKKNCDACKETHVFIEPDEKGDWHIVWRSNFSDFERGFSSNISDEEMTSVKYKTATDTEDDYPFEIGTKYLIFLDKENNIAGLF